MIVVFATLILSTTARSLPSARAAAELACQPDHQLVEQVSLERRDTVADFDHAGAKRTRAVTFHVFEQPLQECSPGSGETAFALDMLQRGLGVVMREVDFYLRLVVYEDRLRRLTQRAQEILAALGGDGVDLARAPAMTLGPHRDHRVMREFL